MSIPKSPHILFAGGGSLGRVLPGLSVAQRVLDRLPHAEVTFVGDGRAIERHTVRGAGLRYTSIPCAPRPRSVLDAARYGATGVAGSIASMWLLGELKSSLVVGLGGRASGAMLLAAQARGVPTVIVEPDCIPSTTTRRLTKQADAVCLAFEQSQAHLPVGVASVVTGLPGRPRFEQTEGARRPRPDGQKRLVVIGGAGGARTLNESVPFALSRLGSRLEGWQVVHQSGEGQLLETEARYRSLGVEAVVVTHIDEMADLLRDADLVVCRACGAALAELALSATPGLLAPDAREPGGSQSANARLAVESGGCRSVDETGADLVGQLGERLSELMADDAARDAMAERMAGLARRDAASRIARVCCEALAPAAATRVARAA